MKIATAILLLVAITLGIASIFWYQEVQYLLPTPVPVNYHAVSTSEIITFDSTSNFLNDTKPKLFHFFSPVCPCSKFNLKHFHSLENKYGDKVEFYVVIRHSEDTTSARDLIDPNIKIIVDESGMLAERCGVYSTPQAALIQKGNKLYFRGNYNRSRYCTDKKSNFVQMAIDSMIAEKSSPHFIELATQSYGCSISPQPTFSILQ